MTTPVTSWARVRGPAAKRWRLEQQAHGFQLTVAGQTRQFVGAELANLSVGRVWFRSTLDVKSRQPRRLSGLSRGEAASLSSALTGYLARHRVADGLAEAVKWQSLVREAVNAGHAAQRWIPEETLQRVEGARPKLDPVSWFTGKHGELLAKALTQTERTAIDFLRVDVRAWVAEVNEAILTSELSTKRRFFDNVERSPLTEEQARAVVCFDNRVHVIAAAGSGKTSVMVARAAYAIERGFVPPDRILLLAFNKAAAQELQERVDTRLNALNLPTTGLKADTFHAFGLSAIGQATGRKPRPAPWLEGGQDVVMVARIVDELRDRSVDFRFKWDLFRLLYARISDEPDGGEPDHWDRQLRRTGFQTANDETVRSEGERLIADWLFYNGVDYQYERPYVHDVADKSHSQYRPDFYYPQIDVWHEHWALGTDGKPPAEFTGYAESMTWKKQLHSTHGTTLVETTWAKIIDYSGFVELAQELTGLGLELDWNPDRTTRGAQPVKHEDLARLVRTFMTHVKSNSLTPEVLAARLAERPRAASPRTRLFLDLYWQIHHEWQVKLAADDCVDFEDMLVRAAEHLEAGDVAGRYDLVMVDEFQDASHARARLARALVKEPGRYLLAVGDDWQSINRFAGADISVMTNFEEWFGPGQTLRLQTTFRCPQAICDVATTFVTKNPRQLGKQVTSAHSKPGAPVTVVRVSDQAAVTRAIAEYLEELVTRLDQGGIQPGRDGPVSVFVLGRYNFDKGVVPRRTPARLDVTFRTVHGSKGLEADYIVIPNLSNGVYGFPSRIADDPVLDIAMANPDDYPHAEERRLLYVALTRARREVVLIAVSGTESPFIAELIQDGLVTVRGDEAVTPPRVCPRCSEGLLVERTGKYGQFCGCTRFPRCTHTERSG